jgi:hypothetical protein
MDASALLGDSALYAHATEWAITDRFLRSDDGRQRSVRKCRWQGSALAAHRRGQAPSRPRLHVVSRAPLAIARLDRLSRNVDLIISLMEIRLDFVATDFPHANRFAIHFLAAIAEYESGLQSQRIGGDDGRGQGAERAQE